jgi:protein tyrosine phosphatase (PTP) superfamily phosphohydrolase (DUF442 family)
MAESDSAPTCPIVCAARRRPLALVAILIIAVLVAVFWKDIERLPRRFVPRNLGVVEDGRLYRSGQIHRSLLPGVLRDRSIESVVCLTYDPGQPDFDAEERIVRDAGAEFLGLRGLSGDGVGDIALYVEALQRMKQRLDEGKTVLVHCSAGSERTGALIYFWRTLVRGVAPIDAWQEVLSYGHDDRDNPKLRPYINANLSTLANILVERGVIARVPDPLPLVPAP